MTSISREGHVLRLKHVASIAVSNVDKKSAEGERAVRLCNYIDVYYNATITSALAFMEATASEAQIRQFTIRPGDVLITKDSETPDDIAVPAYVEGSLGDVLCGYHLAVIRPYTSCLYPKFLYWSLASTALRSRFGSEATGVTRFGLRADSIANAPILLPSREAQQRIADFLDAETARIDALVEKKRRMIELLGERRMAAMTEGIEGRLTGRDLIPSALPWLGVRPAHWPEVKLTLIAHLGSGHTPSRDHPEWWEDCTIPWITTGEVAQMRSDRIEFINETREMISESGVANSSAEVHPAGTVVLCRTASAGYSAIMARDMATSQDFATWTCGPLLRPRFLLLCLRVMRQDLLGRLAMGSTHQTIYMPDIEAIRVSVPPVLEQDEIVDAVWERLKTFDVADDLLRHQIALLLERRQALITAAVTGELDLAEAA